MKKRAGAFIVAAVAVVTVGAASVQPASAHNRAHIILPSGACIVVGSEKSVALPDGSWVDLRPETPYPSDEYGAAYAADEGRSRLQKFGCPSS